MCFYGLFYGKVLNFFSDSEIFNTHYIWFFGFFYSVASHEPPNVLLSFIEFDNSKFNDFYSSLR